MTNCGAKRYCHNLDISAFILALAEYETAHSLSIELDGVNYAGSYRVMTGSVIVRYDNETRSAQYGANRPETVARWLLADLCRKCDSRKRKAGKR
ncbi:conserved hypothetical protein [Paraburkholderia unamae]|uniref:hypothetical protein n=1 Tax=Paraburkholderia unamae TaxID=219649 RepID=UPI000DC50BD1|nr:hypothetical protein C7401_111215 [Paraburkholderia unamae]CAG9248087.1 conserved hypothetical protein [Paraburkholderia unamae]